MKNSSPLPNEDKARFFLDLYRNAQVLEEKELYDYFLDQAVKLTKSKIGFFHFVTADQKTIKLTTWNKEALKNCKASYDNHYPIEKAGNWADCVRFKRPIMYNNFASSPNQKGLPEGHVNIKRILSVPIIENDKTQIIFGVGNKAFSYTEEDMVTLKLVANELNKIIKQRRAEKELRESQKKYYSLFANMTEGFFLGKILVDNKGNPFDFIFLEVNNGFEIQSGLKREEVIGKTVRQVLPGVESSWIQTYGKVALTGQPIRFENYNQNTKKWYEVYSYCPTRGEFAAIFSDITERKKKEDDLKWQNLVIRSAQDAIISTDSLFNIKSWNHSAETLFGWNAKEAIGKSIDILQIEYPTINGTTRKQAREQLMNTGFWKEELVYHRKDGSSFFGSGVFNLLKDKDGKTTGLAAIIHDITPRKLR
ncbi:MAG: PAS domain S-box protein, partial [Candidatus Bathyarchaeota archaeon]